MTKNKILFIILIIAMIFWELILLWNCGDVSSFQEGKKSFIEILNTTEENAVNLVIKTYILTGAAIGTFFCLILDELFKAYKNLKFEEVEKNDNINDIN